MTHKTSLFLTIILLFAFCLPAIAQNSTEYYHDLHGMVDTAGVVHLFYRHYQLRKFPVNDPYNNYYQRDDIIQLNLETGKSARFLEDYRSDNAVLGPHAKYIHSFAFFFHDPGNYIYASTAGTIEGSGLIIRCDTGSTVTFDQLFFTAPISIGVTDSSDRVYAGYGSGTMLSTDGGYHWKGYNPDSSEFLSQDSTIPAGFLSVAPFNEYLAFFDSTSEDFDYHYLEKTTDGGMSLTVVDTSAGRWKTPFYYDADSLHVYAMIKTYGGGYELRGSSEQGDAGSWRTLFRDSTRFYVSLDQGRSGVLFLAEGRRIYKFDNYGANIDLSLTPWQTLPDTANTIVGIYKNPRDHIVYALTDSALLKVTPSGIFTLSRIITSIEQPERSLEPARYVLHQNYPNPFNPTTTIRYELAKTGPVTLTVWNVLGRRVAVLANGTEPKGMHQVSFDASRLSSGVYFYRLQAGDKVLVKKMLLMK